MYSGTEPLAEITREALRMLFQEIGIVNTVRFLNQYTAGYGNYTWERQQLFGDVTLDEIIADIKRSPSGYDNESQDEPNLIR